MVFSSHIFLFCFLPLALLLYYSTPVRARSWTLTAVSYVFYGWWNPWFTVLMFASTLLDYACGKTIAAAGPGTSRARGATIVSVSGNLAVLGFFKYALFFAESANWFSEAVGWGGVAAPDFLSHIVLPVGISFYTFQSMSYSIDLYRGHAEPSRSFIDFCCYVSMFPQLVAGPIVRYGSVAGQLRDREHSVSGFVSGFTRFNYGFAKKVLLANPMGSVADMCFEAGAGSLSAPLAWTGVLAYSFQIYFDFSGYSDMALGLGRMLGFHFPENFDSPYRARSVSEFWRRWHISLSSFLRDYLYIPLGGNRKGEARTYANLLIVMLVGGLWHGAQWTFVAWGGLHGLCLAAERLMRERANLRPPAWVAGPMTFLIVLVAWVFFRAPSFSAAWEFLEAMGGRNATGDSAAVLAAVVFRPLNVVLLTTCALVVWLFPNTGRWLARIGSVKVALGLILLLLSVRVMALQGFNPFLYFQF